ncbi:tetratricopeptide repeat protein [Stieleria sp. JC731]|uniref:tetratricopeptide repeat protein n=1 Tax=Pirellulaceae TaxID=2691357 RepID=UPI001E49C2D7|nr:tetratricopeptide repeat protein [Stieleria sp. JC731]
MPQTSNRHCVPSESPWIHRNDLARRHNITFSWKRLTAITFCVIVITGCGSRTSNPVQPDVNDSSAAKTGEGQSRQEAESNPVAGPTIKVTQASLPSGYVGTNTCAKCHPNQLQSYLKTHHSRSLQLANQADCPTGHAFDHAASKRDYQVIKQGDHWFHHENRYFGETPQTPNQITTGHYPVEYVMGSGAFAKAYLVRDGDYLLQSPITWYAAADRYAIAPGYDTANQQGFRRVVTDGCMYCHAGLISSDKNNTNRLNIHELAIGCERCHGPGEKHSEQHNERVESKTDEAVAGQKVDTSIFNPALADRSHSEAVCAQCHLDGDVTVFAEGKDRWDFRPGEALAKLRSDYKGVGDLASQKTFSNHFDQMWKSECYTQTETLTCITCHDPHSSIEPVNKVEHFRKLCLSCHGNDDCHEPLQSRNEANQNACVKCHMPQSPSDVPHTSTTNHRIAVYSDTSADPAENESESSIRLLTRGENKSKTQAQLSDDETTRREKLAAAKLAILQVFEGNDKPILAIDTGELIKSLPELTDHHVVIAKAAYRRGQALSRQDDPSADQIQTEYARAHHYAVKALREIKTATSDRQELLELLADKLMMDQKLSEALPLYEELVRIRRDPRDWFNLALCYADQKRIADAENALQQSIQIDPSYAKPYSSLAKIYVHLDQAMARQYESLFRLLSGQ